jgi:succinate-acetate transporter protein
MEKHTRIDIKDVTSNPAPLGLFAFGMTTVLLNFHNAGFYELGSMILAMGLFYGGLAQVIAGIMEWKKGNTFGTTAFLSFGFFWLTLLGLVVMPELGWFDKASSAAMVAYLVLWGIFTALMFIGTLKLNRALQFIFASLVILFFLLAIGDATGSGVIREAAGYVGIICGASAIYTAIAQLLNELYNKTLLPLGPIKKKGGPPA